MKHDSTSEFLMKIYEQNDRIIELLEKLVDRGDPLNPADSPKDDFQQNCIEKMSRLTPREHQIIELILEGKLNKEIAYAFSISLSTVESHRSNIMRKLDANNVAQLIKTYLQCTAVI